MRELTANEKRRLWDEVREEFPEDEMMQEVHYVRLLHYYQTKGFSRAELVQFFESARKKAHA